MWDLHGKFPFSFLMIMIIVTLLNNRSREKERKKCGVSDLIFLKLAVWFESTLFWQELLCYKRTVLLDHERNENYWAATVYVQMLYWENLIIKTHVFRDSSWPSMTGIWIYRPKWRLHMAVVSAWFTSHVVPICVKALLRVSLTHTRPPPSHIWHQPCGFLPIPYSSLPQQRDVLQFHCVLTLIGVGVGPQVMGSIRCDRLLPQMSVACPRLSLRPRPTCYKPWFPDSFLGFCHLLEELTELGNTYLHLLIYYVIKDVMKETDDQPDKERQGCVWRGLEHRGSYPQELECICLWLDVLSKPGSTTSPNFGDFYGGFIEEANRWLNLRSPRPFPEEEG